MTIIRLPAGRSRSSLMAAALVLCVFGCASSVQRGSPVAKAPNTAEPAKESSHPASIALWPNGAPGSEARKDEAEKVDWRDEPENNITFPIVFNIHNPSITPFLPSKATATGAAVIIAPGGGHMFLTIDREGYDLGKWLADHGVAAFVLKYRLARDKAGNSPYKVDVDALADAKRSIRLVRSRAAEWGVDPARVGFMGFSAGGEVAALVSSKFDKGDPSSADAVEKQGCRPDFVGLIYGSSRAVTTFDAQTPPTFLLAAYNDSGNATTLTNLFLKLKAANVPAEIHIYGTGGHGFGVRSDRSLAVESWPQQFRNWMGDIGMLKSKS
jgi:endo-1,4-beta-xylanase